MGRRCPSGCGKRKARGLQSPYLRADQHQPTYDNEGRLIRNARLVVDGPKAERVRRAFELRAAGRSHLDIGQAVDLSKSMVSAMLTNRVFLGEARGPGGAVQPEAHEAVVCETLFAALQARRGQRVTNRENWAIQPLLNGLVKCAEGGYKMQVIRRTHKGERVPSYTCMSKWEGRQCSGTAADTRRVDECVVALLDLEDDHIANLFHGAEQAWLRAQDRVSTAETELDQFVETAFGLRKELFQKGLDARQSAVNEAKAALYDLEDPGIDAAPMRTMNLGPPWGWVQFQARGDDPARDRLRMRRVISEITIARADPKRRRWQPIEERLQIKWKGE